MQIPEIGVAQFCVRPSRMSNEEEAWDWLVLNQAPSVLKNKEYCHKISLLLIGSLIFEVQSLKFVTNALISGSP